MKSGRESGLYAFDCAVAIDGVTHWPVFGFSTCRAFSRDWFSS